MGVVSGIVVYVILWWVIWFMVLPWGVRIPDEPEKGHATSAPERPMLWRKAMVTGFLALLCWLILWFVQEAEIFSFRQAPGIFDR